MVTACSLAEHQECAAECDSSAAGPDHAASNTESSYNAATGKEGLVDNVSRSVPPKVSESNRQGHTKQSQAVDLLHRSNFGSVQTQGPVV